MRLVFHIDMDAFFPTVEVIDNPSLRGKPVIVGGVNSKRGVVSSASYEARRYGVRSGMSIQEAKRLCPGGIFLPVRHDRYVEFSYKIRNIFFESSPKVEMISIDEAFLDMQGVEICKKDPIAYAEKIREKIKSLGLSLSIGISYNKFMAKMATEDAKPDGILLLNESDAKDFLGPKNVEKLWGVGDQLKETLNKMGIFKVSDIWKYSLDYLFYEFGKRGEDLYYLSRGIDRSEVVPYTPPKSLGKEITLEEDILPEPALVIPIISYLSEMVGYNLRLRSFSGNSITLKIKFHNHKIKTKSKTIGYFTSFDDEIFYYATKLFLDAKDITLPIRLLGIYVGGLKKVFGFQLDLSGQRKKRKALLSVIDEIRKKYGFDSVIKGVSYLYEK